MVKWTIKYTKQVVIDSKKLKQIGLKEKTQYLLDLIAEDPYKTPPNFEKLLGFRNVYSRRINIKHRLVYELFPEQKMIKVLSVWGHYEDN
ncbi:MAG: Txe/YoeB family addiction module toxin [Alphaproteobacteria bacterium]|nr:Txe/YoeB family addiction module toxin [Alphaproteobacteria bacterium]MBR2137529.1 Txe/YoeB family addiction module toxin [Alphaproteobacteria bacterium]